MPGDDERDYFTISTSALSLLRTLESDHAPALPLEGSSGRHEWLNELGVPLTEKLIIHCGELAMLSCPIGIDWRVTHRDDSMQISDVVRVDNRVTTPLLDLAVELPFEKYRRQIVAFAEKAKEPFVGVEKEFDEDDYDRELYPKFWAEYDGLLARHSRG